MLRLWIFRLFSNSSNNIRTSDNIRGQSKERQVYSGERQLLGVATMHKSNMVPVFADKKEDAKILLICEEGE